MGASLLASTLLLSACTASIPTDTGAGTPTPTTASTTTADVAVPELTWASCRDDFECSTLTVPLDWSDPDGATIDLALIRKPARGADRIGSLLVNPGGPGEPGVEFLTMWTQGGSVPAELAARFDLVSWDPRGTGDSGGIRCMTDQDFTEPDPLPYPPTQAERDRVIALSDVITERCEADFGEVIPHVGTRATVRDLDMIRAALGDEGLTYVGYSYGSTIGLEYLRMYPDKVRAVVLDGISLPGTDPVAASRAQMQSFEESLDLFLEDCRTDASCTFGGTDPKGALGDLLDELGSGTRLPASYELPDDSGTVHVREGTLGYTEAVTGIATGLYNQQSWFVLRSGLAAATQPVDPSGHVLLMMRDLLRGRQPDGTWTHSVEANASISCADRRERSTSYFGDVDRIEAWGGQMPVFGRFGAAGLPGCFDWPDAVDPLDALQPGDLDDAPGVVIVNARHDPATPYAAAVEARSLLSDVSLVTWGGSDHTSFASGHACVDDAVVPYLVERTMPPASVDCDP